MKTKWQILTIIALAIGFAWYYYPEIIRNDGGEGVATDLASYYYAGELAALGRDYYDFTNIVEQKPSSDRVYPYIYPPPIADVFAALSAWGGIGQVKPLWSLFSCICLAFGAAMFLRRATSFGLNSLAGSRARELLGFGSLCVLVFAICWLLRLKDNLILGQVNIFVLFFIIIAIVGSKRQSFIISGCALAIAAMLKITPVFLLPFLAPAGKNDLKRFSMGFVCCAVGIIALSSLAHGYGHWLDFVSASADWGYGSTVAGLFPPTVPSNVSFAGLYFKWLGDGSSIAKFLSWATVVIMFGYLFHAKRKYGFNSVLLPLMIAVVASSPMAYRHHFIFLLPGVLAFVDDLMQSTRYSARQKTAIASAVGACLYLAGFPWDLLAGGAGAMGVVCNSAGAVFLLLAFGVSVRVCISKKRS